MSPYAFTFYGWLNWFKFILSLVLIVFLSNMPDFFAKNPWVLDIIQVPEKFLLFGGQSRKEKVTAWYLLVATEHPVLSICTVYFLSTSCLLTVYFLSVWKLTVSTSWLVLLHLIKIHDRSTFRNVSNWPNIPILSNDLNIPKYYSPFSRFNKVDVTLYRSNFTTRE